MALVLASVVGDVYIDCDGGSDMNDCSVTSPCKTLAKGVSLAVGGTVLVYASETGRCELEEPLVIEHPVQIDPLFSQVTVSGGKAISGSLFKPVSAFPDISNQIQSATARSAAMVVNIPSATGLKLEQFGWPHQHYYMGGSGCILPGRIAPTMMRFFVSQQWQPMAQFPDDDVNVHNLTQIVSVLPNRTVVPSDDMQPRMAAWMEQFASPLPDVQARGWWNGIGWAISTLNVTTLSAPTSTTPGSLSIGNGMADESNPAVKGYFSVIHVLAELSQPGEWHLNRTSGNLVVYPPPSGLPSLERGAFAVETAPEESKGPATVSVLQDAIIQVRNTGQVYLNNLRISYGNGPGLSVVNSTDVSCLGCVIENVGMMAVNVTGGARVSVEYSEVGATGSGGIFLTGGDRNTLTPGNHSVVSTKVHGFSRITQTYAPGVYLSGVGNTARGVELYDAPHECLYFQGNNHALLDSDVHDCVQKTRDSGAVYAGRDWSARGNVISGTSFHDIDTHQDGPGGQVHAVYLDDSFSGLTVENCSFTNVSTVLLLGGGRNNIFRNNTIHSIIAGSSPILFDDRDEGWAKSSCHTGGILLTLLAQVPYNTSKAWITAYPDLVNILNDDPCLPKYNRIENNTFCNINNQTFIDQSGSTIASWGSFASNNIQQCP